MSRNDGGRWTTSVLVEHDGSGATSRAATIDLTGNITVGWRQAVAGTDEWRVARWDASAAGGAAARFR